MTIAEKLKSSIEAVLGNLGISGVSFTLEHPTELSHGDYATNVALAGAKQIGKNPREVAEMVVAELEKNKIAEIESVSIAGPGFINFKLDKKFFAEEIPSIISNGEHFGKISVHAGKKILVEHSSPNLFKPFHVGHMMNNAIGESLVRLMKASGAEVHRMSFPSDISLGIAKAIFIILEKQVEGQLFEPHDIVLLGNAYVEGTKRYDEDESVHGRVKEIANNLYGNIDSPELRAFIACKDFNVKYFEHIVGRLGSEFDSYIFESEAGVVGKDLVLKNTPSVFTESDGAIVYIPEESKKHISTSVFINSQGNPTYEAKDLGLLDLKFERENPDLSLFVTDYQQIPHFDAVLDAAEKINKDWKEKSVHVPHGRMSFKGQKMSSRLGNVPLATDILDTILEEVVERSGERDLTDETKDSIAIGAIKFAILRAKPGQNINFDPETSLSFEGDSGPYLQYTHARISSLIEKGAGLGIDPKYSEGQEISDVEKIVYRLPEVVEMAVSEYAPQYVVTYLLQVAQAFNSYYASNIIVDEANKEISAHRLAIAQAVQIVLKNGLNLLGIKAPTRM
jgi:arginyl-tRNA synthetase